MDEEISTINNETRKEKIINFFIKNKKIIILIGVILALIPIIFFSYKVYSTGHKERIANKYNSAIIDYSNGDLDAARDVLTEVINQKDSTYSPLALYFIIDNNLKDRQQINDLFEVLINKTSLEDEIKNLIIYKKALYNADFFKENELLGTLKPVLNSESVWKSHALYLVAEYLYSKNEKQKSKEFFNQILAVENANKDIVKEAQKRLQRDLSE